MILINAKQEFRSIHFLLEPKELNKSGDNIEFKECKNIVKTALFKPVFLPFIKKSFSVTKPVVY